MARIQKMVNPTPFDVKIPYERGVYISVPADGESMLSMQQFDDFCPGKPGSEAAKKLLDFEGVYVADSDLSYDYQALQALQVAVRERKERIKNFTDRTRNSRNVAGAPTDDATMEDIFNSAGYGRMEKDVEKLEARIKTLSTVVSADESKGAVRQTLDPKRTIMVTNPPRQFPSVTAMEMYLNEHPDIKEAHEALTNPTHEDEAANIEKGLPKEEK